MVTDDDHAQARPDGAGAEDHDADTEVEAARVERRSELLPEEAAVGSDDPQAQAEAVLQDSDERVDDPEQTRRDSTQTPS